MPAEYHRAYWKRFICEQFDIPGGVPENELNKVVDAFIEGRDWAHISASITDVVMDPVIELVQRHKEIEEEWDDHYRSVTRHEAS